MRKILILLAFCSLFQVAHSQEYRLKAADRYLTTGFKAFFSVDNELAYCMAPILEERLFEELKDSISFLNPFDSLGKYLQIETSEDKQLRVFSWDRRSGGTWHDMASYAQFKAEDGGVLVKKLYSGDEGGTGEPTDVLIYEIHQLKLNKQVHYLLLAWGTHGGGQHHALARVYRIENKNFQLCENFFEGEKYLYVGANRGSKLELKYQAESGILSHFQYEFDDEIGFYKGDGVLKEWTLGEQGFQSKPISTKAGPFSN